jgi:predicted flap endonuclease-1-like 5' DNA nuclease
MDISCVLIPVVSGLIFGILGFYLGKKSSSKTDHSLVSSLQSELDACKKHTKSLTTKISSLESDLTEKKMKAKPKTIKKQSVTSPSTPAFLFDTSLTKSIFGKKIKENDLKIVEGIGPKIEALFNAAGITTWHDLSEASIEKLQAILDAGGENFAIHNPSTWGKQALMAYQGKWQELKDLQSGLIGGKE